MEDYEKINKLNWCIKLCKSKNKDYEGKFYASNSKVGLLHRYILDLKEYNKKDVVDHINRDTLDCRRENIRICTHRENKINNPIYKSNKSGCMGVMWYKHTKTPKWVAFINIGKDRIHLGYFTELEDAIKARKDAELKYYGGYLKYEG